MIARGAGSHACCGVRSGSLSRLAARVAGDAVRRGQVQADHRQLYLVFGELGHRFGEQAENVWEVYRIN